MKFSVDDQAWDEREFYKKGSYRQMALVKMFQELEETACSFQYC